MNTKKIREMVKTVLSLPKKQQSKIKQDHDVAWRLACLVESGLIRLTKRTFSMEAVNALNSLNEAIS